jgi:N-acetylmuramoyl-L-alanine amidase
MASGGCVRIRLWITLCVLFCAGTASAAREELSASLSATTRAVLDRDHAIYLLVTPHKGDAWTRLALRHTGRASTWKQIAELNRVGENLTTDRAIRIPLAMLTPELQRQVLRALFPADRQSDANWTHKVVLDGGEGESLWKIAEWFTGDGARYTDIRKANPGQRLSTRKGDSIVVPDALLVPGLRRGGTRVAEAEDDPRDPGPSPKNGNGAALAAQQLAPGVLEYGSAAGRPYAVYRLQRGEALYSSVAIRFTGRVYAKDVYDAVEQIVAFNDIRDVAKIPAGRAIRIPMELLLPEFRPSTDPRRIAEEEATRESQRVAKRVRARDLKGVHVILDPGHGGRDVGTVHDGLFESDYVYDIAVRVKDLLEKKTQARVSLTTKSPETGYRIINSDVLPRRTDHVVMTSPQYVLEDPVVGVHLRWYLANSILARAVKQSVEPEKVVFISIHADSLHPSLRGAMAYVPGQQLVQGSYGKNGDVYLARKEVRENPTVTQSQEEALRAEGLSTEFARSLIRSFDRAALPVHPFKPVRDNVVRDGKEWVPAVIRFNKVPTRVLLEVCNLGNEEDRRLMKTRRYRQSVAEAIHDGIVSFYSQQSPASPPPLTAKKAK